MRDSHESVRCCLHRNSKQKPRSPLSLAASPSIPHPHPPPVLTISKPFHNDPAFKTKVRQQQQQCALR